MEAAGLKLGHLYELAPKAWWLSNFPIQKTSTGFNWDSTYGQAVDALIGACEKVGVYRG